MSAKPEIVTSQTNAEEPVSKQEFDDLLLESSKSPPNSLSSSTSTKHTSTCSASFDPATDKSEAHTGCVIFRGSDVNAAVRHVLVDVMPRHTVVRVFVHESVDQKLTDAMVLMSKQGKAAEENSAASNATSNTTLTTPEDDSVSITDTIKKLEKIHLPSSMDNSLTQSTNIPYAPLGCLPKGIVTIVTFRTTKEAIEIINNELAPFEHMSIWHQNHSVAYEFVLKLKCRNFYFNCYKLSLESLEKDGESDKGFAKIEGRYHFERLIVEKKPKYVVFPVGSIFAN